MDFKFIITGDSWSQGEWDGYPSDYRITHSGIHQYLVEAGYSVKNVGRGGYNNIESLNSLLAELPNDNYTHCLFFFTDPLRQSTYEEFSTKLPSKIIRDHKNYLLESIDNIGKNSNIKIILIGGCSKIILDEYKPTNIDFIVPSFTELVIPSFIDSEFMNSEEWYSHWLKLKTNCTIAHKSEMMNIHHQAQFKFNIWKKHNDLFWPDGIHANRLAHKLLFDHLLKEINLR